MTDSTVARSAPLASLIRIPGWFIVSPARYIGLAITLLLSQWALFRADGVFARISGYPTLDTQNGLTVQGAVDQIRSYAAEAVQAYELFAVIDYLFPLAGGLFQSATLLWLLRVANRSTPRRIPEWTCLLLLLPVVFDYVENIFLAAAVATEGASIFIGVALVAKSLKLASLILSGALTVAVLIYTAAVVSRRRIRHRPHKQRS